MACYTRTVYTETLQRVTCATQRRCVVPKEFSESIENATDIVTAATARAAAWADMKKATEEAAAHVANLNKKSDNRTKEIDSQNLKFVEFLMNLGPGPFLLFTLLTIVLIGLTYIAVNAWHNPQ